MTNKAPNTRYRSPYGSNRFTAVWKKDSTNLVEVAIAESMLEEYERKPYEAPSIGIAFCKNMSKRP